MLWLRKQRKKELAKQTQLMKWSMLTHEYHRASYDLKPLVQKSKLADHPVVVSLTSYGQRIDDVYLVLESIAQQTVKPNRVILWLAEDEIGINELPLTLQQRLEFGLEVRFCPDIRSYKKIIPTLELCPDSIIITLDDDIIYPHDTIENLLREHHQYPQAIIGCRAHEITFANGKMRPYRRWNKEVNRQSQHLFVTSGGGTLFPPHSLFNETNNRELFMQLCPHADDIWLNIMARLQSTEIRKAKGRCFSQFVQVMNNQTGGLNKMNVDNGLNDKQLEAVLNHFKLKIAP